jgi:chemotaxis response regulator CheB
LADGFYRSHSIDALFSSLAHHAEARTIGVILSGLLKDGTFGLKAIKEAGGIALVQDPDEAAYPEMPRSAIKSDGAIDLVGPIDVSQARYAGWLAGDRAIREHWPELRTATGGAHQPFGYPTVCAKVTN